VLQPLWPFVKEKEAVEAALAGEASIASCQENYYAFPALAELSSTAARE